MKPKRMARNAVNCLLATGLILLGYVRRAKDESFQEGVITSVKFHNPSRKLFRKIVDWFRENGYVFLSCDQLLDILEQKIPCPRGAVWVSLDDGWKGNIDNVIPTAVEYNIPITIFIYTDAIEDGTFWWQAVNESANRLPAGFRDIETIWKLPEDSRKQVLKLISQVRSPATSKREAMTVEDVRCISKIPQVALGSHTVTHAVLPNCSDYQVDYELRESKRKLEEWAGTPIRAFAYPRGYFDNRARRFLQEYGYGLAATAEQKFARSDGDRYLLPRTDVMDDGSFAENLCHALGLWEGVVSRVKRIIKR